MPLAGVLAIGRRSWPKAVLVFFWFAIFLITKGTSDQANIEDASFFRLLMPSFPAFLLLLAIPAAAHSDFGPTKLLRSVPALPSRVAPGAAAVSPRRPVAVVLPLIFIAGTSAQSNAEAVTVPVPGRVHPGAGMHLEATVTGGKAA